MDLVKKLLSLVVTTAVVLLTHQQTWAADPAATDTFWNTATTDKPAAKPAPPAPKPAEPPAGRESKPSVSAELLERLNSLEKKVAELSAPKEAAPATASWTTGYKDGGGGFFVASPDQAFVFKLLGYVQANHMWMDTADARLRANGGRPVSNDFFIRRARIDFAATVHKNTEVFVEFEGGVPTNAPQASSVQSDFALIEAKITHRVVDPFQLRFGKFLVPFSNENALRSSRALDTAERYAAVNTLVTSPAIECQQGVMVMGHWAKKRYDYALGVFNGNNRTVDNYRDDNSQKNVAGHFTWKPLAAKSGSMSGLAFGLGWDWDRSLAQTLTLRTLSGSPLSTLDVKGDRLGFSPDLYVPVGKWVEIRGEALMERFNDSRANLYGGYGQVLWNVFKTDKGMSFQPLVRAESAVTSESVNDTISRLNILTVGWNFHLNKNVVWRMNYLPTHFRYTGSDAATTAKEGHYDEVINQIQVKF
jgi:hypothetical protein